MVKYTVHSLCSRLLFNKWLGVEKSVYFTCLPTPVIPMDQPLAGLQCLNSHVMEYLYLLC